MKVWSGFRCFLFIACVCLCSISLESNEAAYAFSFFGPHGLFHHVFHRRHCSPGSTRSTGSAHGSKSPLVSPVKGAGGFQTRASWYGGQFQGRRTASGQIFNTNTLTAASPDLPFGTKVLVKNPVNGKTCTVVINDRGPYVSGRGIDLSHAAAKRLGISGVSPVICYADGTAPGGFRSVTAVRTSSGGYHFSAFKRLVAKIKHAKDSVLSYL